MDIVIEKKNIKKKDNKKQSITHVVKAWNGRPALLKEINKHCK